MEGIRNIKSLTMDELTGTINEYPWFGAARRELCERMSKVGGSEWGREQYAEAAMYIASRTIISDIVRSTRKEDYSDKDVETLLKKYIAPVVRQAHQPEPAPAVPEPVEGSVMTGERSVMTGQTGHLPRVPEPVERPKAYRRTVRAAGGDFFSSEQYNEVKREDDDFFSRFKAGRSEEGDGRKWEDPEVGFCTETLAWVYADQGYFAEAKKIYSRLMLRYPEKIAYFATLIEKLDEEIKK